MDRLLISTKERLMTTISYSIFITIGIVGYAILVKAADRLWKSSSSEANTARSGCCWRPFIVQLVHMAVADVGLLISQLILAVPLSATGYPLYGEEIVAVLATSDTLFFNAIFYITMAMCAERATRRFAPTIHSRLFANRPAHLAIMTLPWLLAIAISAVRHVLGCPKKFDHEQMRYDWKCDETTGITTAFRYWQLALLVLCTFLHIITVVSSLASRQCRMDKAEKRRNVVISKEVRLIAKADMKMTNVNAIFHFMLIIEVVTFYNAASVMRGCCAISVCFLGALISNWTVLLNSAAKPIIYLAAIKELRDNSIFGHLKRKNSLDSVHSQMLIAITRKRMPSCNAAAKRTQNPPSSYRSTRSRSDQSENTSLNERKEAKHVVPSSTAGNVSEAII